MSDSEPEVTGVEETGEVTSQSLLDKLKCPKPSSLSRKRSVPSNPPRIGKKKSKRGKIVAEPHIAPSQRVKEFPEECFCVTLGKLFCEACRESLSVKKSVLCKHIKSSKHIAGKKYIQEKGVKERKISDMLRRYDETVHPIGETLSESVRIFRVKVVTSFMRAGVPINKIDCFRELLEEGGLRLTDSQNLRQLVPFIEQQELDSIKSQIKDKQVSVII